MLMWRVRKLAVQPVYSHDRTIITLAIIASGTVLLLTFGEQPQILVLVSSAWTLALTFWFRVTTNGAEK
ncbi:MAG TPA: hypothetical protein VIY48_22350 [Candidatus Paceibacterota bacterium]